VVASTHTAQTALQKELVAIFSDLAELFGNPRSYGAIYGLLFAEESPLSMDEIIQRIAISKGTASQGLRHLEDLGAIVRKKDGRGHLYAARLEIRPLVAGFLNKRLLPGLSGGRARLKSLAELVPELPPAAQPGARLRIQRITKWHNRAATLLPFAEKLLQKD
jgi:HTH-type transcriptional regulator, glycine betaine synthesis regulator